MNPVRRIIYEHGITAQIIGSDWHIINIVGGQTERIDHLEIIKQRYKVRPVILTMHYGSGPEYDMLLRTEVTDSFGLKITELEQRAYKVIKIDKILNIGYLLRAMEYHCKQLALLYTEACNSMKEAYDIPGLTVEERKETDAIYGMCGEPYYEFDALITAVRRAYDSCRYILWHFFGAESTAPRSFYSTLKNCPSLPVELSKKLNESWSKYGEEITAYCDCIQHNSPIDFGVSSLSMHKLDNGAWSTRVRIPDNPSAKSRFKFTYDNRRDARGFL